MPTRQAYAWLWRRLPCQRLSGLGQGALVQDAQKRQLETQGSSKGRTVEDPTGLSSSLNGKQNTN